MISLTADKLQELIAECQAKGKEASTPEPPPPPAKGSGIFGSVLAPILAEQTKQAA